MAVEAYPLAWPKDWKRENGRDRSAFSMPAQKIHAMIAKEILLMGGTGVIVSSNVPPAANGRMRLDREPVDPGVAVYFTRNGKQMVFACDRYNLVRDNVLAIAKTIEAMRGIERWGASSMMERAFAGFGLAVTAAAEPAAPAEPWWDVLEISPKASAEIIQAAHRAKAKKAHPDRPGGSYEQMVKLNAARDAGLKAVQG